MIGNAIDSLPLQRPRKIDILRLYFGLPKRIPDTQKITSIVKCIQDHHRVNAIRIKGAETIRIKTKRLVKSCKYFVAKRKICRKSDTERRKQELFHQKIQDSFDVAENLSVGSPSSDSFSSQESDIPSSSVDFHLDYHLDSDVDGNHDNSDAHADSDPDYDPSEAYVSSHEKKPIPASLLREVSESRGSYRLTENLLNVGVRINGGNPNMYGFSKSSLWSKITKLRTSQKNELLASLADDTCKIVLQFDGKSCSKLNERHVGNEERFFILCHTEKGDVPLGFFALDSKSGLNCATQILKSLAEHNLSNRIVGIVCDTERTNTGNQNGACALVEDGLEFDVLHLMCQHHAKEVLLRDVFVCVFGRSQAANITIFNILIENWSNIKRARFSYSPIDNERLMEDEMLLRMSNEAMDLISQHAKSKKIRDDYAELNDLILKFLGKKTNVPFKVVGATNNARWMARIIYALKTYLFREHLNLDSDFVNSLERFCIFVALIYTKHWNRCSIAVDAPYNDLQLIKELDEYMEMDREIATVALAAHKRHLWYLSDELVVLGLFSKKVPNEVKMNMVNKITQQVGDRTENSIKHTAEIDNIRHIQLDHFISERSFFFFEQLRLDHEFLNENPEDWNEMNSFKTAKQTVEALIIVVNDAAERGVQLGANTITNQRVQSDSRLQDFIISTYSKNYSINNYI